MKNHVYEILRLVAACVLAAVTVYLTSYILDEVFPNDSRPPSQVTCSVVDPADERP